jgi:hypothetical protein
LSKSELLERKQRWITCSFRKKQKLTSLDIVYLHGEIGQSVE